MGWVIPLFGLTKSWLTAKPKLVPAPTDPKKALLQGTEVVTSLGDGIIEEMVSGSNDGKDACVYRVTLPNLNMPDTSVHAYIQASEIQVGEDVLGKTKFPPNLETSDDVTKVNPYRLVIGAQPAYVFARLYHVLYDRLVKARELCENMKRSRHRMSVDSEALRTKHHLEQQQQKKKTKSYE